MATKRSHIVLQLGLIPLVNSGYLVICRNSDTHNLNVSFMPVIVACYSHCVHLKPSNDCMLFTLCVFTGLQIIFQNLSDIMSGRNQIPSDIYENLLDINLYKNFIKS